MKPILWIIAVIVLQAVVAALAKKAQANAQAAKQGMPRSPKLPVVGSPKRSSGAVPGAPRVLARGETSVVKPVKRASPRQTKKPQPIRTTPSRGAATNPRVGDSSSALASRQHVVDSIARIREAEAKVAGARVEGLANVEIEPARMSVGPRPSFTAVDLTRIVRDPEQVRRALVLGEILGRPRCDRAL